MDLSLPSAGASSAGEGSLDSLLRAAARSPAMAVAIDYIDPEAGVVKTLAALPPLPAFPSPQQAELPVVPREAYDIHGEYARGGMGRVLIAHDRRLGRRVAIKEVLTLSGPAVRRFVHEAVITARLQHPGIVPVHEVGRWPDGTAFYAMKLVEGRPLSRLIRERPSLSERLGLLPSVLAVAEAMAYAHSQRVLHRDLKPDNVIVGAFGETVVIDWGLALRLDEPAAHDHGLAGTPAYMAPELCDGTPANLRTDVYALGALLYHLLRGAPPYRGASAEEVLSLVRGGPPTPLSRCCPQTPPELAAIAHKAMAPVPAARYPSAQELAQDLARFLRGQLVLAHRYSPLQHLARFVRRHRATLSMATLGLLGMGLTTGVLLRRVLGERLRAERERGAALQALGLRARELSLLPGREVDALLCGVRAAGPALRAGAAPGEVEARGLLAAVAAGRRALPLRGHAGAVQSAEFSPDGAEVVTGGDDGRVLLWDARGGELRRTLVASGRPVRRAAFAARSREVLVVDREEARILDADSGVVLRRLPGRALHHPGSEVFSPDGSRAVLRDAGGSEDFSLWDARTGRVLSRLPGLESALQVRFSGDGRRLIRGGAGEAMIYDTTDGHLIGSLRHERTFYHVALSPDGARAFTGSDDGRAVLWDVDRGVAQAKLAGHSDALKGLAFSPDGERALSWSLDNTGVVWDARRGARISRLVHERRITQARFAPQGDRVVTGCVDGSVRIWEATTGSLLATLRGHEREVSAAAFSPDGTVLVTAGADRAARLHDVRPAARPAVLRTRDGFLPWIGYAPGGAAGPRLLSGHQDGSLTFWNPESLRPLLRARCHDSTLARFSVSADGRVLATREREGPICLWDLRALTLLRRLEVPRGAPLGSVSLSPDASLVAVNAGPYAILLDGRTGAQVRTLSGHAAQVSCAELSPDGARLVTSSHDGTARLWDVADGRLRAVLRGHAVVVNEVHFSPDGQLIATASDDHTVRTWDGRSGAARAVLRGHGDEVWHLAFSPDSTRIASGSVDRTVRLWDARAGVALAVLSGHTTTVDWPIFSPDGERLVSVAAEQTAWLWDARAGRPLRALRSAADQLTGAAFSPDGRDLLTCDRDGVLRRFDGRSGAVPTPVDAGGLLLPVGADAEDAPAEDAPPAAPQPAEVAAALGHACRLLRVQPEYAGVRALCEGVSATATPQIGYPAARDG